MAARKLRRKQISALSGMLNYVDEVVFLTLMLISRAGDFVMLFMPDNFRAKPASFSTGIVLLHFGNSLL